MKLVSKYASHIDEKNRKVLEELSDLINKTKLQDVKRALSGHSTSEISEVHEKIISLKAKESLPFIEGMVGNKSYARYIASICVINLTTKKLTDFVKANFTYDKQEPLLKAFRHDLKKHSKLFTDISKKLTTYCEKAQIKNRSDFNSKKDFEKLIAISIANESYQEKDNVERRLVLNTISYFFDFETAIKLAKTLHIDEQPTLLINNTPELKSKGTVIAQHDTFLNIHESFGNVGLEVHYCMGEFCSYDPKEYVIATDILRHKTKGIVIDKKSSVDLGISALQFIGTTRGKSFHYEQVGKHDNYSHFDFIGKPRVSDGVPHLTTPDLLNKLKYRFRTYTEEFGCGCVVSLNEHKKQHTTYALITRIYLNSDDYLIIDMIHANPEESFAIQKEVKVHKLDDFFKEYQVAKRDELPFFYSDLVLLQSKYKERLKEEY